RRVDAYGAGGNHARSVPPRLCSQVARSGSGQPVYGHPRAERARQHRAAIGRGVHRAVWRGSMTINPQRTGPWIWSAIEFDGQGNFVSPQHEIFPTYSVYMNGQVVSTLPQSALGISWRKTRATRLFPRRRSNNRFRNAVAWLWLGACGAWAQDASK